MAGAATITELSSMPVDTGPFSLSDDEAYAHWREGKLAAALPAHGDMFADLCDPARLSAPELDAIKEQCRETNFALFRHDLATHEAGDTRRMLKAMTTALGLHDLETHRSAGNDGIVALEETASEKQRGYIPYTDRPIGWHTDGYYNYDSPQRMIRAMVLYCARDAETGGANSFLDHEIAYIRLRDENPDHIAALMHPEAMTIPANNEADGSIRPDNVGPVFVIDPATGALAMRYTRRKRNIIWRDDAATRAAVAALEHILDSDKHVVNVRLEPGTGVLSNNVLHARSGFVSRENAGRLFYRVRSYDRINDT